MLTVEGYGRIRIAHRSGVSVRAIARTYHHSRRNVREALAEPQPPALTPRPSNFHAPNPAQTTTYRLWLPA